MKYVKDMSDFELNAMIVRRLGLGSGEGGIDRPWESLGGPQVTYLTRKARRCDSVGGVYMAMDLVEITVDYCNRVSDAFPLIEANRIALRPVGTDEWEASHHDNLWACHKNPLRAAMSVLYMLLEGKQ